jgi:pimeloyl-ACP methyl ester carboxylesterase
MASAHRTSVGGWRPDVTAETNRLALASDCYLTTFSSRLALINRDATRKMNRMAQKDSQVRNVVLVHGAWADGSSWSGVIEILQKDGYHVTAVQTSMNSLSDDVARVRSVLAMQNGPTILAGHSFGGAVMTGLGKDAPNVVGLVYAAAFAPAEGESLKTLASGSPQPPGLAAIRPDAQGMLWLDPEGVVKYFAPDLDPAKARVLAAVQKPIAASEVFDERPFGEPAWKFVPSWYIVAENDQMIPPDAERFMAQRAKATVTSIPSSHVVMISHAKETAQLIEKAAKATSSSG